RGRAPRPHPASRAAAALRATGPRRPTSPPGFHRTPAETAAQTDPRGPRGPLANSVAQKVSRVCADFETKVELLARPPPLPRDLREVAEPPELVAHLEQQPEPVRADARVLVHDEHLVEE